MLHADVFLSLNSVIANEEEVPICRVKACLYPIIVEYLDFFGSSTYRWSGLLVLKDLFIHLKQNQMKVQRHYSSSSANLLAIFSLFQPKHIPHDLA